MGLFGFIKDVALTPIDAIVDVTKVALEETGIIDEDNEPSHTSKRMESMGKNLDDTYDL